MCMISGASGSQLFKTAEDEYIIKTLEGPEYTFILQILDSYVLHLGARTYDACGMNRPL